MPFLRWGKGHGGPAIREQLETGFDRIEQSQVEEESSSEYRRRDLPILNTVQYNRVC